MKKTAVGFLTLLIMISMMTIGFTGCGSSPQNTVDSFFKAIQAGETEKAAEFAEEGLIGDTFPVIGNLYDIIDRLYAESENAGVNLTEEIKAPYEDLASKLTGAYISSYEVGEFTENEDGTQTADITLNYAYSGNCISAEYIQSIFTNVWRAYKEEHADELNGMDNAEMITQIMTGAGQGSADSAFESITAVDDISVNYTVTLKKNDDGKWLISNMVPANNTDTARAYADQFFTALISQDTETIEMIMGPDAAEQMENMFNLSVSDALIESMLKGTNLTRDDLSESANEAANKLDDYMKDNLLDSYEIKDVKEENGVVTVTADLIFGYNDQADLSSININDMCSKYLENNNEKFTDVISAGDTEGAVKILINGVLPEIVDKYIEILEASGKETREMPFSMEFKDGNWVIF